MASESLPIFIADAFTKTAFAGNPAAVCLVAHVQKNTKLTGEVMQKIGAEMNLSETSFITSDGDAESFRTNSKFGLRWFTPTTEVYLCGHATLASAAVLFNKIGNGSNEISFETLSGTLKVKRNGKQISMDFPLNPSIKQDRDELMNLLKVVVDISLIQALEYSPTTKKLMVRLNDSVTRNYVRSHLLYGLKKASGVTRANSIMRERHRAIKTYLEGLQPQISRMVESEPTGKVKGVIVTLRGCESNGAVDTEGRAYDFISRYFAPWVGIPEDPVTGAAHTVLASYWSKQLNKQQLYARQCSPRGGDIYVHVVGSRVHLAGEAVVIMSGTLDV